MSTLDGDRLAFALGRLEHHVVAHLLDERAQAAGAGRRRMQKRAISAQRRLRESQVDAVHLEQGLVLAHHARRAARS